MKASAIDQSPSIKFQKKTFSIFSTVQILTITHAKNKLYFSCFSLC